MLLVNFVPRGKNDAQRSLEKYLQEEIAVRALLKDYVLVRVPRDERVSGLKSGLLRKNRGLLIDDPAFKHLGHNAGLAIVDYQHTSETFYGDVVTALPFKNGKYYRWENSHLAVALGLPAGTITQRTMVWAVRTHPEAAAEHGRQTEPALGDSGDQAFGLPGGDRRSRPPELGDASPKGPLRHPHQPAPARLSPRAGRTRI